MTETTNYGLKKPGLEDNVDIEVLNSNFDIIDEKIKMASSASPDTNSAAPESFHIAQTESAVTITETMSDGTVNTYIAPLDENKRPTKIVVNGRELVITWEGFDA